MNIRKFVSSITIAIFAVAAAFTPSVSAAEKFDDKATVEIQGMPGGGTPVYTLEKTGEDKGGNGTYRLLAKSGNRYLTVIKANAGSQVGWTSKDGEKGSEWILIKNSAGWSIIAKDDGANAVTRSSKASSGIELQRNQGTKEQLWNIAPKK